MTVGLVRRLRTALVVLGALVAWLLVAPVAGTAQAAPGQTAATGGPVVQAPIYVGMRVCKRGSTTGYTCGTVLALNQTVCYPQGCISGLVRTNMFSAPGDNGAPVYNAAGALLGYVVGGNSSNTWFDPI